MFQILVVEDDPDYFESLRSNFKKLPQCIRTDFARNVQEGEESIQIARRRESPYDGALLDCKIEDFNAARAAEEMNTSLCADLRTTMPD